MARRLSLTSKNTLVVQDHLSGTTIEIYYRQPTTQERQRFSSMAVTKKNGKVKFQHTEARLKWGADILMGFRDGDFEVEESVPGVFSPMASDPESPNFRPDWKEKVTAMAPDIIELLALKVFEASVASVDPDTDDDDDADPEDTTDQD